jgi:hypothetical protein
MGAPGTPDPGAGAGAGGGPQPQPAPPPDTGAGAGAPPSQAPGSQEQIMLAKLYQACKALAQANPVLASGLSKAAEGIQEAQTSLVTQPRPNEGQTPQQSPPY